MLTQTIFNTIVSLLGCCSLSSGVEIDTNDILYLNNTLNVEMILEDGIITGNDLLWHSNIYSITGENKYECLTFKNGNYVIYDKYNDEIVDAGKNCKYANDGSFYFYFENNLNKKYGIINETGFYDLVENNYIFCNDLALFDKEDFDDLCEECFNCPDNCFKINNYFYFENLHYGHGWNNDGSCGIVAAQILFQYYDTFYNDQIIPEKFDYISNDTNNNISSYYQSPSSSDEFFDNIRTLAIENELFIPDEGMNSETEYEFFDLYLSKTGLDYSLDWVSGNFFDGINNSGSESVRNAINNNQPIFVACNGHCVVAYAYDSDHVYFHSGWGVTMKASWDVFNDDLLSFSYCHTITININDCHVHSNNYLNIHEDAFLCPCGHKSYYLSVEPEDFDFEPQYFFYNKNKTLNFGDITISTTRLRCGYIENSFVNLSPRRTNAGYAFLELNFSKPIERFDVSLSFWSNNEMVNENNSAYLFEYYSEEDDSYVYYDYINFYGDLSKDRYNQDILTFLPEEPVKKVKISACSEAVGSRNYGRLSIGKLTAFYVN